MNNNTIQNNGNQYFQENNFYGSNYVHYKTEDCIASVQKVGKLSWAVIAAILGMIADIITIAIGYLHSNCGSHIYSGCLVAENNI